MTSYGYQVESTIQVHLKTSCLKDITYHVNAINIYIIVCKMKCKVVILILAYAVTLPKNTNSKKEDPDRWIWGFVDPPVTNKVVDRNQNQQSTSSSTESSSEAYDPCAPYDPPKPSFKAPGRRINEEKCEEYIYDIKLLDERVKRTTECNKKNNPNTRPPFAAVGGRPTFPGEFPHMGAIGWKAVLGGYIFKCGSTLISNKFVLTAAHCIRAPPDSAIEDPDPKIVRLNDQNIFRGPNGELGSNAFSSDMNISRIIVHPQYKSPKKYYDIALMELEREVYFTDRMQPACLWNKPDYGDFGKQVSLTGWGVLAQGSFNISPHLQAADVDIIDTEQCDNLLEDYRNRHWMGLTDGQLCAGRLEGGVDACQGDSGGPLQFRRPLLASKNGNVYYVIGVTSFGIGCALPNHPGIYTRVSTFVDWIEEHVWK